jgi:hypothetical protein
MSKMKKTQNWRAFSSNQSFFFSIWKGGGSSLILHNQDLVMAKARNPVSSICPQSLCKGR